MPVGSYSCADVAKAEQGRCFGPAARAKPGACTPLGASIERRAMDGGIGVMRAPIRLVGRTVKGADPGKGQAQAAAVVSVGQNALFVVLLSQSAKPGAAKGAMCQDSYYRKS